MMMEIISGVTLEASEKTCREIEELLLALEDEENATYILIKDEGAGKVWVDEYTGGSYQSYTGTHGAVVGEYNSYSEAEKDRQEVIDSWHCWLVINNNSEGQAWVEEYIDGPLQDYTGPHASATECASKEEALRLCAEWNEYYAAASLRE